MPTQALADERQLMRSHRGPSCRNVPAPGSSETNVSGRHIDPCQTEHVRRPTVHGVTALVAIFCLGLPSRTALACSYANPSPVAPDSSKVGVDVTPPELLKLSASLERGIQPSDDDVRSGCLKHSYFSLNASASDDQTPAEKLAWRLEALRGDPPLYHEEPVSYMYFVWEEDGDEPIDFELRVRAVDEAGNESNPVDIRITDPGAGSDGGCALVPRRGEAPPLSALALLALAWAARRRQG